MFNRFIQQRRNFNKIRGEIYYGHPGKNGSQGVGQMFSGMTPCIFMDSVRLSRKYLTGAGYRQSNYTNHGWTKIASRKAAKPLRSIYFFASWRENFIILPIYCNFKVICERMT